MPSQHTGMTSAPIPADVTRHAEGIKVRSGGSRLAVTELDGVLLTQLLNLGRSRISRVLRCRVGNLTCGRAVGRLWHNRFSGSALPHATGGPYHLKLRAGDLTFNYHLYRFHHGGSVATSSSCSTARGRSSTGDQRGQHAGSGAPRFWWTRPVRVVGTT